jgi:HK97 family phage prohead protease
MNVSIEPGGAVLRGLAVPFHQPTVVVESDGRVVAEVFDHDSIRRLPDGAPLLVGHDRATPPVGIITTTGITSYGVGIEAQLVGSDNDLDAWRKRLAAGLMSGLSVGFTASGQQRWQRPARDGEPPTVTRRGVEIIEVSLVHWPAYDAAGVVSVSQRTGQRQREHEVATEMIAEYRAQKEQAHRESERVILETQVTLRQVHELLERCDRERLQRGRSRVRP